MANRILKDSINESRSLSECSFFTQDLYKRLITYADDYGRFNLDTTIMLARLYPREMDVVTENDITDSLHELIAMGKIGAYYCKTHITDIFGAFPKWGEHQRLRNTRAKCPEPEEYVNDWYYRRAIPIALKIIILERDKFKCQLCGKNLNPDGEDAKRLIKMRTGLFDIDHIVPVSNGGRATAENLRTTCYKCNRSRKRKYTPQEILANICGNSPQIDADVSKLPLHARVYENPIQYESNTNTNIHLQAYDCNSPRNPIQSNPNPIQDAIREQIEIEDVFSKTYEKYPRKDGKARAKQLYTSLLTTGRKLKDIGTIRFNHQQIYFAVLEYADGCTGKEEKYIKQFDTFLGTPLIDYAEKSKPDYEAFMADKYGDNWEAVKFEYI